MLFGPIKNRPVTGGCDCYRRYVERCALVGVQFSHDHLGEPLNPMHGLMHGLVLVLVAFLAVGSAVFRPDRRRKSS